MLDLRVCSVLHCPLFSRGLKGQKLICKTEFIEAAGFDSPVSGEVLDEQVRIILNVFCLVFFLVFCIFFLQTASVYMERKCPCSYT